MAELRINRVWDYNYTYVPAFTRSLLETEQLDVTATTTMSTKLYFNYTIKFYTTDFGPMTTVSEAFSSFTRKLNSTQAQDAFGLRLRQNAAKFKDLSLFYISTDNRLALQTYLSFQRFEHSAFPSSQPTTSPSAQPSSQPSGSPTSNPTFMKETVWNTRLSNELAERFDIRARANRAIYFQVDIANRTYLGSPKRYEQFMVDIVRRSAEYKVIRSMNFIVINGSTQSTSEFFCAEEEPLRQMRELFRSNHSQNISVSCGGDLWQWQYCQQTDIAPTLCVNCMYPCQQRCYTTSDGFSNMLTPHFYNCSYFHGNLKILNIESHQYTADANYVVLSYGALGLALLAAVCLMWCYHRYLSIFHIKTEVVAKDDENGDLSSPQAVWAAKDFRTFKVYPTSKRDTEDSVKTELVRKLNEDIFGMFRLYHSKASRLVHVLIYNHRALRVFSNFHEDGWYVLWITSCLTTHALLLAAFFFGQHPYDYGQCAAHTDKASCEADRTSFIDYDKECTWWNDAPSSEEGDFGDVTSYQTNCIFNINTVPGLDVLRLAFLAVLGVGILRIMLFEPFLKRFILARLTPKSISFLQVETPTESRGASQQSRQRKLQQLRTRQISVAPISNLHATSATSKKRKGPSNNTASSKKLPGAQQMKDFVLEVNLPAATKDPTSSPSTMSLVPRLELDDGLKTLDKMQMVGVTEDEFYKYELELRVPEKARTSDSTNNGSEDISPVSRLLRRMFGTSAENFIASGSSSMNRRFLQIIHRAPQQYEDESFRQFYNHLLAYRLQIYDFQARRKFDRAWAVKDEEGQFHTGRFVSRSFAWQLRNNFHVHQAAGDYFHEYVTTVNRITAEERDAASQYSQSLQTRILYLFTLDVMGHLCHEATLLRRRLYRQLCPRKPISLTTRLLSVAFVLAVNVVFVYLTWLMVHRFPRNTLMQWYRACVIAMAVDFCFVENVDNFWHGFLVPSICLSSFHRAKEEVIRIILNSRFLGVRASPSRDTTTAGMHNTTRGSLFTDSMVFEENVANVSSLSTPAVMFRQHQMLSQSRTRSNSQNFPTGIGVVTAPKLMTPPVFTNSTSVLSAGGIRSMITTSFDGIPGSSLSIAQRPFNAVEHCFASYKFARLFPGLSESQLVLQYRSVLPRRIVVGGRWYNHRSLTNSHLHVVERLLHFLYSLVFAEDVEGGTKRKRGKRKDNRQLAGDSIERMEEGAYSGDLEEDQKQHRHTIAPKISRLRSTFIWIGSFPTMMQRLVVLCVVVSVFSLIWYLLPTVSFISFWWVAGGVLTAFLLVAVMLTLYYHVSWVHYIFDEAQHVPCLAWMGLQPDEYLLLDGDEDYAMADNLDDLSSDSGSSSEDSRSESAQVENEDGKEDNVVIEDKAAKTVDEELPDVPVIGSQALENDEEDHDEESGKDVPEAVTPVVVPPDRPAKRHSVISLQQDSAPTIHPSTQTTAPEGAKPGQASPTRSLGPGSAHHDAWGLVDVDHAVEPSRNSNSQKNNAMAKRLQEEEENIRLQQAQLQQQRRLLQEERLRLDEERRRHEQAIIEAAARAEAAKPDLRGDDTKFRLSNDDADDDLISLAAATIASLSPTKQPEAPMAIKKATTGKGKVRLASKMTAPAAGRSFNVGDRAKAVVGKKVSSSVSDKLSAAEKEKAASKVKASSKESNAKHGKDSTSAVARVARAKAVSKGGSIASTSSVASKTPSRMVKSGQDSSSEDEEEYDDNDGVFDYFGMSYYAYDEEESEDEG